MIEILVGKSRVVQFEDNDLNWPYDSNSHPNFTYKWDSGYGWANIPVDTYPGFSHDIQLVADEVAQLPFEIPTTYFLTPFEADGRTNGWATYAYDSDDKKHWYIVLSGKRIPIMPSMTRYLVAHEFGHIVEYAMRQALPGKMDKEEVLPCYAKLRGIAHVSSGSGIARSWPRRTCEYWANDFRILCTGKEKEFWPHEHSRPEVVENPHFHEFWERVKEGPDKWNGLEPNKYLPDAKK